VQFPSRDPVFFPCTVHRLLTPGTRETPCNLFRFRRSQIQYTCTVRAWRRSWSAIGHEQWITWYRPMPPRRRHGGREARIIAAGWWRGIAAAKLARLLRSRGPPHVWVGHRASFGFGRLWGAVKNWGGGAAARRGPPVHAVVSGAGRGSPGQPNRAAGVRPGSRGFREDKAGRFHRRFDGAVGDQSVSRW